MNLLPALIGFVVAALAALVLTPAAAYLARRYGMVDCPDGRRKKQRAPIPLGGGVAVSLAVVLAVGVALASYPAGGATSEIASRIGFLPAALVLMAVGLLDDAITLTGIYKFAGQVLAASLLVASGYRFDSVGIAGWEFSLDVYTIPFSMFFCLGAINAFNLLDGADGLASSVGAIGCFAFGVIAWLIQDAFATVACFAVSGALLGFLRYNWVPARIYLGDTGSMLIGLFVAAITIECSIKEQAAFALAVPIAICAIPILDAAAAMVRRVTTGQSVFTPDRGHLHHALLLRGWTVGETVAFVSLITLVTCIGAIVSVVARQEVYAAATTFAVAAALAATRTFGHGELRLITSRVRSWAPFALLRRQRRDANQSLGETIHLQGEREWNNIWNALREAAPIYNLCGLRLIVNIPRIHESFYATWTKKGARPSDPWKVQVPLAAGSQSIGKLSVIGDAAGTQSLRDMQALLDFLEPLEAEIEQLIKSGPAPTADAARHAAQVAKQSLLGQQGNGQLGSGQSGSRQLEEQVEQQDDEAVPAGML